MSSDYHHHEDFDLSFLPSLSSNNHHDDDEDYQPIIAGPKSSNLSPTQYVFLIMSLWGGSLLNLIGSTTILYSVWWLRRRRKQQQQQANTTTCVYYRLLAVMSVFEIINALNYLIMPFMPPSGTPGLYWASGNTMTCTMSGFIGLFVLLPTWMYSGYLSIYFLLVIRYSWTEQQISKRLEIPAFLLAVGVSLSASIHGARTQSFNARPSELLCLTEQYPYNCLEDPTIECERGGNDNSATSWYLVVTALVSSVVGLVCTVVIYWTVYSTYVLNKTTRSSSLRARTTTSTSTTTITGNDRRLRAVAKQSALYFLIYLNVLLWPLATELMYGISNVSKEDRAAPLSYTFDFIGWFFFSVQGWLNMLVYIRPRYESWRSIEPTRGRIWAVRKAIGADPLPRNRSSTTGTGTSTQNNPNHHRMVVVDVINDHDHGEDEDDTERMAELYSTQFLQQGVHMMPATAADEETASAAAADSHNNSSPTCPTAATLSSDDHCHGNNSNINNDHFASSNHGYKNRTCETELSTYETNQSHRILRQQRRQLSFDEDNDEDNDDEYDEQNNSNFKESDPAVLLPVVGQPRLLLKTEKDQQIDQIVQ